MEIFNIQIRKVGNFSSLYKEIDGLLAKNKIISGEVGRSIQQQAVAHSLQNMFKEKYFNVVTVQDCASLANIKISSQRKDVYRSQHCINWGDMTTDFKEVLIAMVMDDFRELFLEGENLINIKQIKKL